MFTKRALSFHSPQLLSYLPTLALLLFSTLSGCSILGTKALPDSPYIRALAGTGTVVVPGANANVASRLLIREASENTPTIHEFFREQGLPHSIEVDSRGVTRLDYIQTNEYFTMRKIQQTWVIDGPYPLLVQDSAQSESNIREQGSPVSIVGNNHGEHVPLSTVTMNQRGDLIHHVEAALQTLESVVEWYTEDSANTERIRRINKLDSERYLKPGTTITIPRYLLRNTSGLPLAN